MKKYSRYEQFCIWDQTVDGSYWYHVNMYCEGNDEAFYILTEFMEKFGVTSYAEIMDWIPKMDMGPSSLVHIYEIADENIETFALYLEDCFNTYARCYGWGWQAERNVADNLGRLEKLTGIA